MFVDRKIKEAALQHLMKRIKKCRKPDIDNIWCKIRNTGY